MGQISGILKRPETYCTFDWAKGRNCPASVISIRGESVMMSRTRAHGVVLQNQRICLHWGHKRAPAISTAILPRQNRSLTWGRGH